MVKEEKKSFWYKMGVQAYKAGKPFERADRLFGAKESSGKQLWMLGWTAANEARKK